MKPRIEQKLELSPNNYIDLLKWIKNKKGTVIYPERIICSRYFDNNDFQMYRDTVEGIVPRKKIRIRTYNTVDFLKSSCNYSLEIKLTNEYTRMKNISKCVDLNSLLENGYQDQMYGLCFQKIDITYIREYFLVDEIRVTIDKNIRFKFLENYKNTLINETKDKNYVLELKTGINTSQTFLRNNFEFPRTRFSKYERALELFNI